MKRLKVLLPLLMLGLISFSCNDDEVETPTQKIVGSWKVTDVKADDVSIYDEILTENPCFPDNKITFQDGGSYVEELFAKNQDTGNCESDGVDTGNWTVSDTQISTTVDGLTETGEIEFVNDNKAVITIVSEVGVHKTELTRL